MLGEESDVFKARYLYGKHRRICGGHKREGVCALPGEICRPALSYGHREVIGRVDRSQPRAK